MSDMLGIEDEDHFEAEVLKSEGTVIVDFWAPWCKPCTVMLPMLEELAVDSPTKIVKVNIDEAAVESIANDFSIRGVPTLLKFENGVVVDTHVGTATKANLIKFLGE